MRPAPFRATVHLPPIPAAPPPPAPELDGMTREAELACASARLLVALVAYEGDDLGELDLLAHGRELVLAELGQHRKDCRS